MTEGGKMRIVAVVLNISLIAVWVFLMWDEGFPNKPFFQLFALLMCAAPVCSLIALWVTPGKGENLLTLYFRRKILEEKKKIEALNNKPEA